MLRANPFVILAGGLLLTVALILFPGTSSAQAKSRLAFTGGPDGGTFQYFSNAIATRLTRSLPNMEVANMVSAGSVENLRRVNAGDADFGLSYASDIYLGSLGLLINDRRKYQNVLVVGYLFGAPAHLVVLEGSGINSVKDLAGKRVAVGPAGSGAAASAQRYFTSIGLWDKIRVEYIGYSQGASALGDRLIDGMWVFAGYPNSSIIQAAARNKIRLLDLVEAGQASGFFAANPFYAQMTIPAGTYSGVNQPVRTFQDSALWTAGKQVKAETTGKALGEIYSPQGLAFLTSVTSTAREMSLQKGLFGVASAVHPGAQKFWGEHRMYAGKVETPVVVQASPPAAAISPFCDMARDVAQRGAGTFEQNQTEGLQLFIKARELCPEEPLNAYNLGIAYHRYGRLPEAQQFLEEAAKANDERNPVWLADLAQVLLERPGHGTEALRLAEKAAKADGSNPAILETLARARFAAGKETEALRGLREAVARFSEASLKTHYADLLDRHLAAQLERIKAGQIEQGLGALASMDFEPKAIRFRVQALVHLDRGEEALAVIGEARKTFPAEGELTTATAEVASQMVAGLYREFQSGQANSAVSRAKELAEKYPQVVVLKQAYDKLFEAWLAEVKTIAVPAAVASQQTAAGGGRADQLLAGMGSAATGEVDLLVDIAQNIPLGQKAGRYDVAVVIGNRSYGAGGTPNVDYALRDARIMRQYLIRTLGFDPGMIIYEEDAGFAKFNEIFGSERDHQGRLFRHVRPGQSRVFVYYVGHGAPDPETRDAYFVPVDANPEFLRTNGYRLDTFYGNLNKLPAKEVTVVLDACFSGNSASGLLLKGLSGLTIRPREVQQPSIATVFTSAGDDQFSAWYPEKRHSLFTYFFLKGLQGAADANHDKKITVGEMEKYLSEEVPYNAQRLRGTRQQPTVNGNPEQVIAHLK